MKTTLSVIALIAIAGTAHADLITWNFGSGNPVVANGGAAPASAVGPGVNVSSMSRSNNNGSSNVSEATSASSGYTGSTGTGNGAAASLPTAALGSTSTFFEWTVTPAEYTSLNFSNVAFGSRSTATGPRQYSLRTGTNANPLLNNDVVSGAFSAGTGTTWGLFGGATNTTITGATAFRLYAWANNGGAPSSGTNTWRIDDLNLTYSVLDSAINGSTPVNAGTIRASAVATATMPMNEIAGGVQASTGFSITGGNAAISLSTAATGTINDGATVNNALSITSATAGAVSTSFTIANTGNTADVNRAGVNHNVTVNADIVDGSQASFSGASLQDTMTIDFGTVNVGDSVSPMSFTIANLLQTAGFTADLDISAANIVASGDTGTFGIDLASLSSLAAGGSNLYNTTFDTSAEGTFSATYTILGRDAASVQGGLANGNSLTLTITGIVTPTPGSAALFGLGMIAAGRPLRRRA